MTRFSITRAAIFGMACSLTVMAHVDVARAQAAPLDTADAPEADPQAGEIIVTAQKREQAINKVGMSITAATGDQLETRGITQVQDLVKITPGLTYAQSNLQTPVYTIRGIGFYESTLAAAPAVSVYVDETPLPFAALSQGANLDIQRVEVLKGPQGTLFGQNSTGGAINYVSAKPGATLEAGITASVERFGLVDISAYVGGPVTDTLGVRASLHLVQGGTWQSSITRPDDKLGKQDQIYGRVIAVWQPSDRLTATLNLNRWRDQSDVQALQPRASTPILPDTPTQTNANPAIVNYPYADYGPRKGDWTAGWPMKRDASFWQASGRLDYDLSEALSLTSISAYQRYSANDFVDVDATPQRSDDGRTGGTAKTFYQELRLALSVDGLNALIGGNYERDKTTGVQDYLIDQASFGHPLGPYGTFPITQSDTETVQNIRTYAAFGNVEYNVTDALKLLAGARYTRTSRYFSACTVNNNPDGEGFNLRAISNALRAAFGLPVVNEPIPLGGCINLDNINGTFLPSGYESRLKEDNVSWRAGLEYELDGGSLLYANISKGYKAGGFSTLGAAVTSEYEPVRQESVLAYEAGFKVPLLDRRLQLNAAAFYYDYRRKQLRGRVADPVFGAIEQLVNVPKSRVIGAEFSIAARPLDGFTLNLSGTMIDSKVQKDGGVPFITVDPNGFPLDFTGSAFPFTPKYSGTADAEYRWSMGDVEPFIGFTAYAQSRSNYFFNTAQSPEPLTTIKPYATIDLRAGVSGPDDAWRVMVFGRNVTNEKYWTSVFQADTVARYYAKPAIYGIQLSFKVR